MLTRDHFSSFATVLVVLAMAGCSSSRHDAAEKYYLVTVNVKVQYWQTAASGLVEAARQLGVLAEMVGPDSYDPKAQAAEFDRIAANKPAGILVSAADPEVMRAPIDRAIAQGVPVITMDADSPNSKRLLFVGTNNYEAGRMGARFAAKRLGGKGSVVVYTMPEQENLIERLNGYQEVFGDSIKILEVINVKGDPRVAFDTTRDMIEKGRLNPDGFICLQSTSCMEVADVLDRHKVTGKLVVAMDTAPGTLDWIRNGMISATVAQKPFTMAFYGLKILDDLHHHRPPSLVADWAADTRAHIPAFVDTGATLIDQSNLDAFLKANAPAPSSQ